MYRKLIVRRVNVSEAREKLAELLEAGEEVVVMRRGRPIAKVVPLGGQMSSFIDRSQLRSELPPMQARVARTVRDLRDDERY